MADLHMPPRSRCAGLVHVHQCKELPVREEGAAVRAVTTRPGYHLSCPPPCFRLSLDTLHGVAWSRHTLATGRVHGRGALRLTATNPGLTHTCYIGTSPGLPCAHPAYGVREHQDVFRHAKQCFKVFGCDLPWPAAWTYVPAGPEPAHL